VALYGLPPQVPEFTTIKVIMLRTAVGSTDGYTLVTYEGGREYDLPEALAKSFFSIHAADPAEAHEGLSAEVEPRAKRARRANKKPAPLPNDATS
jgi:hypothetical protein